MKATFFVKEILSLKIIIFVKSSIVVKETSFNETFRENDKRFIISRIVVINEYRPFYIDIKNVIVFAYLKIKKAYNARY